MSHLAQKYFASFLQFGQASQPCPASSPLRASAACQTAKNFSGPVVGVIGAKGGVGASTLALNIGACMGQRFGRTTILDANLYQPDIAFMVGSPANWRDMRDLLHQSTVDDSLVVACRQTIVEEQLFLLTAPGSGEAVLQVTLGRVSELLRSISGQTGLWIVDLPKTLNENLVSLIDQCRVIVLVTDSNAISLSGARRWLAVLNDLGHYSNILAVTKTTDSANFSNDRALELSGAAQVVNVPAASRLLEKNMVKGRPAFSAALSDSYSKAIDQLVTEIARTANWE